MGRSHYLERGHTVVDEIGGLGEKIPFGIRDESAVPIRQAVTVPNSVLVPRAIVLRKKERKKDLRPWAWIGFGMAKICRGYTGERGLSWEGVVRRPPGCARENGPPAGAAAEGD